MKTTLPALLTLSLLALSSCFWGSDWQEENIVGNYWASTIGGGNEYYLHYDNEGEYGAPLMPAKVLEAGHNERVIIIKSCIDYYIIPLKKTSYSKAEKGKYHDVHEEIRKKVMGPFTKAEFHQNMAAIGEDSLMTFDQQIDDCH
jgi:hypothetical protein